VRILVAAPPKTGNMWVKCLLGTIYGLRWLKPAESPRRATLDSFRDWVAAGGFQDGTIYHQHYDFDAEIPAILASLPAHLVTLVRDPYDAFVSTYYTLQQHWAENNRKNRRMVALMGKPLDDPAVIDFLRDGGYRNNLQKAQDWMGCPQAVTLRYEALHADPTAELARACQRIAPVAPGAIAAADEHCSADNMRQRSRGLERHVRAARPDDARQRLGPAHLTAFRDAYADLIEALGYPVR
jgi:hypothetical protein